MHRLEVDRILNGLAKLTSFRRGDKGLKNVQESPAQCDPAEDELYSLLRASPYSTDDTRMLTICRARVEGCGEDSFLAVREGSRILMAVFDGCGGSGGRTCAAFGGHTGAWVASRAASVAARQWFASSLADGGGTGPDLEARVNEALQACKSHEPAGQVLLGSLSRAFPTTVAAFHTETDSGFADFYWCGDSRGYLLDKDGLHQVTADDTAIQDAMLNLREDAPMTNVASASSPFEIHEKRLNLEGPSLILAATDGCFGYLPSPMAFERLLLQTLSRSTCMREWRQLLEAEIGEVSGDDYTLAAWPHGFESFRQMKSSFRERLAFLEKHYPTDGSETALFEQWGEYRKGYESMMSGDGTDSERG